MCDWTIENDWVSSRVRLDAGRLFWFLAGRAPGAEAGPSALSEVVVQGRVPRWARAAGRLIEESAGCRALEVEAFDDTAALRLVQRIQIYEGHSFVRLSARLINDGASSVHLGGCSILDLNVPASGKPAYGLSGDALGEAWLFHVEQFSWLYRADRFARQTFPIRPFQAAHEIRMGSFPSHHAAPTSCAWAALRQASDQPIAQRGGLVLGIEFNGKSRLSAWAEGDVTRLTNRVDDLAHVLEPGAAFDVPAFFIGRYRGDWDEAAHATHRFAEAHVHPPPPDDRFPWVQYNSWGYDRSIDEAQQLEAIERCASLGLEAVVLDLGWSRGIGDWRPDPVKFPRGLKPLSDRCHELGMAFGLHVALAQMHPEAPAAKAHPEWMICPRDEYFGAGSICLGHAPCREWLLGELVRLVDGQGVDYIVQDGEDMVKGCPRSDHTHATGDSNYANSERGLDLLIEALRRERPRLVLENCEDGGCMLTYKMARLFHTSVTVDSGSSYVTRQGIFGASYPFSLRYSSRYMTGAPDSYSLRSALLGGPFILMQRITEWNGEQMSAVRGAVSLYKALRDIARHGRVVHLVAPGCNVADRGWGWDAIQVVSPTGARSAVLVFRAQGGAPQRVIKPRGLDPSGIYQVRGEDRGDCGPHSAERLATEGILLELPETGSEILWLERRESGEA
jgi:alpha-galactosidase